MALCGLPPGYGLLEDSTSAFSRSSSLSVVETSRAANSFSRSGSAPTDMFSVGLGGGFFPIDGLLEARDGSKGVVVGSQAGHHLCHLLLGVGGVLAGDERAGLALGLVDLAAELLHLVLELVRGLQRP